MDLQTEVVIIGGGATGAGIARDLSLRGIPCLLVEKGDFTSGASGRNHGLLHSGARYAANDAEAARECAQEGALLKRLAPQCIQDTGGLFVAVAGDDERFVADLRQAVASVRESPEAGGGMAPVYGMAASLPVRSLVGMLLTRYIDKLYEP